MPDPRRKLRRRWPRVAAGLALLTLIALDHAGCLLVPRRCRPGRYEGAPVRVAAVVDGQTLEVLLWDRGSFRRIPVRLTGIGGTDAAPIGPLTDLIRRRTEGRVLTLRPTLRRPCDRVLHAHLDLADGTSIAEALLMAGLARTDENLGHLRLERYAVAERRAKGAGIGRWNSSR